MKLVPHKYQERAVEFSCDVPQSYQMLDLGMGKTVVTLLTIKRLKLKAIVFGPLRPICSTWPEEIRKWTPELSYYICHGPDKSLYGLEDCDIILMNYEGIPWFSKQKGKWKKRMVIFDEASMLKSHSTSRFGALKRAHTLWLPNKMCLGATPAPNHTGELWSQYFLLDRGERLGKNISAFRQEYCSSFSYPGMPVTLYTVKPELVETIYEKVAPITYRLDASDYLDMPPITYNTIHCELTNVLAKQYKELEDQFFVEIDGSDVEAPSAATLSMKLRQFVQGGLYDEDKIWMNLHKIKLNALKELLAASAGQPILCAIQFRGELEVIRNEIGLETPVIAGGVSPTIANQYITAWNNGDIPLLLCHPASLSHGVNLQMGGHVVLWYGLTWSLEQYLQLNGRLHRQGQKDAVIIHHLVMKDTIDEAVMAALRDKNTTQRGLLNYIRDYKHERS